MSDHQVKVLEHAQRELEIVRAQESPHLLPLYQKFLKIENHRLRLRHQAGGGGREVCASRASLIDVLLRHIFAAVSASAKENNGTKVVPVRLVALRGLGRAARNPASRVVVRLL